MKTKDKKIRKKKEKEIEHKDKTCKGYSLKKGSTAFRKYQAIAYYEGWSEQDDKWNN